MREILRQNNEDLLEEIGRLQGILQQAAATLPPELTSYYRWVTEACNDFKKKVVRNLNDLRKGNDQIIPYILSQTQGLTVRLYSFNSRLVSPVLRQLPTDRLCLKLLKWLHTEHATTQDIPAAFSDGGVAIWPAPPFPTVYFLPPSFQHRLLYLPLLFHEFGHLMYACHESEMDDLVSELQKKIAGLLEPGVQRDDLYAQEEAEKHNTIVERWYEWTQEIFCDAVGLVIGGPAYLHAFSMFFRMLGRDEYYLPLDKIAKQTHPLGWLRIRLLADRARHLGHNADAESVEKSWDLIAAGMNVNEEHHGFYDDVFQVEIRQTIDDMLTEADPRQITQEEFPTPDVTTVAISPVQLLNQAWQVFFNDSKGYPSWERNAIHLFSQG